LYLDREIQILTVSETTKFCRINDCENTERGRGILLRINEGYDWRTVKLVSREEM